MFINIKFSCKTAWVKRVLTFKVRSTRESVEEKKGFAGVLNRVLSFARRDKKTGSASFYIEWERGQEPNIAVKGGCIVEDLLKAMKEATENIIKNTSQIYETAGQVTKTINGTKPPVNI